MKYSPKFFKNTMPEWKRKKDSIVAQIFHRPISYVFSSIFAEMGLTPNQVSFISLIIAFATCACFFTGSKTGYLIGAILMNLWSIVDSADGNMARSIGAKPYGDFIDATSSYIIVGFIFPVLGLVVYQEGGLLVPAGTVWIIVVGAYASSCDTMARLFFQKMKSNTSEIQLKEMAEGKLTIQDVLNVPTASPSVFMRLFARIDSELSIGGWNLIAIVLCVILECLDLYIIFYAFYFPAIFLASMIYFIKKTGCLKK